MGGYTKLCFAEFVYIYQEYTERERTTTGAAM